MTLKKTQDQSTGGIRRFEFVDDKSSKFWEIHMMRKSFNVRHNKIG